MDAYGPPFPLMGDTNFPAAYQPQNNQVHRPLPQAQPTRPQQMTRIKSYAAYPSPEPPNNIKLQFLPEYQAVSHLIKITNPSVVRQVVRDLYHLTLLGSDYHLRFLLNATFHQANPEVLDKSVRDFGAKLVSTSLSSVLSHVTTDDLDRVADELLPKLSDQFLDRALKKRLRTIHARPLVNALAKAERLGYNQRDIVEQTIGGTEIVIPHQPSDLAQNLVQNINSQNNSNAPQPSQQIQQAQQIRMAQSPICCTNCARPCSGPIALQYHKLNKMCNNLGAFERINIDTCAHCGSVFDDPSGLTHHLKSQICGSYTKERCLSILLELQRFYRETKSGFGNMISSATTYPMPDRQAADSTLKATNARSITNPLHSSEARQLYSHLCARDRASFEAQMRELVKNYNEGLEKIRADTSLTPSDRLAELTKIKNRLHNGKYLTRRKFGVRVRKGHQTVDSAQTLSLASHTGAVGPAFKKRRKSMESEAFMASLTENLDFDGNFTNTVPAGDIGYMDSNTGVAEPVARTLPLSSIPVPAVAQQPQSNSPSILGETANQHSVSKASNASVMGGTLNDPIDIEDDDNTDSNTDDDDDDDDNDIPSILPQSH